MLIDDRRSAVSLPEVALLGVLPGTGGLTRLTDKRRVRRDRADVFCSTEEGMRGGRAVEWRLVDEVVPPTAWQSARAGARVGSGGGSDRPARARCRADADPAHDGREFGGLPARAGDPGPRTPARDDHSARSDRRAARRCRRDPPRGRGVLSARTGTPARRRDPASSAERAHPRTLGAARRRRSRAGARGGRAAVRARGRLAGARNPAADGSACSSGST